jgi:acylphosphatase
MNETTHTVAHFTGRVQGVGFRFQALQVAREFEVAGFVQNLPDGRVRLEAEGARAEIDAFIVAVAERMGGHIRKTERTDARRAPQFTGFSIR